MLFLYSYSQITGGGFIIELWFTLWVFYMNYGSHTKAINHVSTSPLRPITTTISVEILPSHPSSTNPPLF
jgi:hypothetical protein